jgi:hypothetical protein
VASRLIGYCLVLAPLVLLPILVGVPRLGEAVAQNCLVLVALLALYFAHVGDPLRRGWLAVLRGGATAIATAAVLVFVVAGAYVARYGQAVPRTDELGPAALGVGYLLIAHIAAVVLARRWWPVPSSAKSKA